MRKFLLSAAAAAPLLLLAVGPALADTAVGSTTSEVKTSTANNGGPDNVTVSSGATVNVAGPVAATLDSSNSLTNSGTIEITGQDNSTTVLLHGGNTGNFINNGQVINTETYTRTDSNSDGVLDGDFAQGTNRYGVHLVGPGALTGSINLGGSGAVNVQGKNSFGVALDAPVVGDLIVGGSVGAVGENSTAISVTAPITGKVLVTSGVSGTGAGAAAIKLTGGVSGAFSLYGGVVSTGYSSTTRSPDPAANAKLVASDLTQAASAVQIGGNVSGGVFIGKAPATTVATDTTTDADHDGIVDSVESAGSIATYGTAPALAIGSANNDVHLGVYGAGANAYGLIIEGSVAGSGVYDTYSGTGVQIGGSSGHAVNIDGGIHVASTGTISGQGFENDGAGVHVLSGVTTPKFVNEGAISGVSTSSLVSQATGILIEAGASVPTLVNSGSISGALTGDIGNASAIVDRSGSLSSITNTNGIAGTVTATSTTVTGGAAGRTIAIDASHNTTGVTLIQNANAVTTITPKIAGDILLGSGNDTVQFNAGTVTGTLDFGQGSGSLLIDNGASYAGKLLATGSAGSLAINLNNGSLEDDSASTLNVSSLNVGAKGALTVSVDPANNVATRFNVSGPATLASGSTLSVKLLSLIKTPESFTIIQAAPGSLTVGSTAALAANTPYLFVAQFTPDTTTGAVNLDLRRRQASEAGLNKAETAAWDPVYENLGLNSGIERAFLAQTDAAGYRSMLNQILPDYAGGVFRALSWASEQQGVPAGDAPVGEEQAGPTRAWTQEIVLDETKKTAQTEPYHVLGVGVEGGLESVSPHGDALGMKIGFVTANIKNPDAPGDNLLGVSELNGGIYWRGDIGGLRADAQLGAGFIWANDRREFLYSDSVGVVHATATSSWTGYTLSARAGLAYHATMGAFFLEPRVHADYFRLHQSGYSEHGGGTGFDMQVDARNGDLLSVTGSVLAGMTFGNTGFRWRPQIELGYRSVLSGDAGSTTTQFIGGSDPFTLAAETVKMNQAIGRIGLRVYSDYVDVLLDGGAALSTDYTDIDIHLTARTVF